MLELTLCTLDLESAETNVELPTRKTAQSRGKFDLIEHLIEFTNGFEARV